MTAPPPEFAAQIVGSNRDIGRGALIARSGGPPLPLAERIERALVLLAYFIELDGDVHIPMYEKFEAELEDLRRSQATRGRARERLARYAQARRTEGDALEEL